MTFPFNLYLLAILSACGTVLVSLPLWRKWCLRVGLVDDPGHRKIHDAPVSLAGGLAVMTGILLPLVSAGLVLWGTDRAQVTGSTSANTPSPAAQQSAKPRPSYLLQYGFNKRSLELGGILGGALGMLAVGLVDDKRELKASTKFVGQFAVAALVAASGVRITLFVPNPVFHYAVTILWILTIINAFNFMDNMNGLCGGLGAIGAWFFAVIAAAEGQYLVALLAFVAFGALLGFLPYNFPRARAFLGDSGSHLVGYLLAVLAILPHFYNPRHPHHWAVLMPLLVLAVPLGDMAWVVMLRWRLGQPFYQGDTNHLSHRLVRLGLSRTRAVLVIWALAAGTGTLVALL